MLENSLEEINEEEELDFVGTTLEKKRQHKDYESAKFERKLSKSFGNIGFKSKFKGEYTKTKEISYPELSDGEAKKDTASIQTPTEPIRLPSIRKSSKRSTQVGKMLVYDEAKQDFVTKMKFKFKNHKKHCKHEIRHNLTNHERSVTKNLNPTVVDQCFYRYFSDGEDADLVADQLRVLSLEDDEGKLRIEDSVRRHKQSNSSNLVMLVNRLHFNEAYAQEVLAFKAILMRTKPPFLAYSNSSRLMTQVKLVSMLEASILEGIKRRDSLALDQTESKQIPRRLDLYSTRYGGKVYKHNLFNRKSYFSRNLKESSLLWPKIKKEDVSRITSLEKIYDFIFGNDNVQKGKT